MSTTTGRGPILITGASSGIGLATALYLARRGLRVIGTSRSAQRLEPLRRQAEAEGLSIRAVELDINTDEGVEAVMPRLLEEEGPIWALVNNAGYSLWGPVSALASQELRAQFETNVFAVVRMTRAVLPGMFQAGTGYVINISSVAGRLATPFNGAYAATKFALEGLSEALHLELAPFGVHVSLVEPGIFRSDFLRNQVTAAEALAPGSPYDKYIERYRRKHSAFERMAKDPVKVARTVHKILRSPRPKLRYPVGLDARLGILGRRLLPERLFLALMRKATLG